MIIHVQVKANSKTDSICIDGNGMVHIRICAEPVEGKANKYLVKYLSTIFRIPPSKIEIIKGENNARKKISLDADEKHVSNILSSLAKK